MKMEWKMYQYTHIKKSASFSKIGVKKYGMNMDVLNLVLIKQFQHRLKHFSPPWRAAPNKGNKASLQSAAYWLEAAIVVIESNIIAQRKNIGQLLPSAGKTSLDLFHRNISPSHVIPVCQPPEAVLQTSQGDIMHFNAVAQRPPTLKYGKQSRK